MYKVFSIKYNNLVLRMILSFLSLAILYTIYFILNTPQASAQETQRTITIVPPSIQLTLNPGEKAEGVMKVINDSTAPITLSVGMRDYIVVDKFGTPNILPLNTLNGKFSAGSWIGVLPTTVTIQPGQRQELHYYVQVPLDARPGGHYAAAIYTPVDDDNIEGSGASVQTQLGSLFYISVNGDITEKASITSFFSNLFQEYGPITLTTDIQNLGDLHIKPTGIITLTDIFGRTIQRQALTESNIFPTASREYENTVGQKWMIGPFTAKILAGYGKDNNLPLMATVTVWVFPWKVTLILVLIIIALVLGVKYWKKRQKDAATSHHNDPTTTETV